MVHLFTRTTAVAAALCLVLGVVAVSGLPRDVPRAILSEVSISSDSTGVPKATPSEVSSSESTKADTDDSEEVTYGLLIDAGSNGSRVYPFYWSTIKPGHTNIAVNPLLDHTGQQYNVMITPGLSKQRPEDVGTYLYPLVEKAMEFIPAHKHATTLIYLKATAGMRVLHEDQRDPILEATVEYLKDKKQVPFQFDPDTGVQVIPGEQEGEFGWLTINALLSRLELGKPRDDTVAVLDLGGASTQITFEPSRLPLEGAYPSRVNGTTHNLYTHSYLKMGGNESRRRVVEAMVDMHQGDTSRPIPDPCLYRNMLANITLNDGREVTLSGRGNFDLCQFWVQRVLLNENTFCAAPPCAINGVHQPTIPAKMPIYAISGFYDIAKAFECSGNSSIGCIDEMARKQCDSMTHQEVVKKYDNPPYMDHRCFGAAFAVVVGTRSYRIPLERPVEFIHNLPNGTLNWALGAMISIVNDIGLKMAEQFFTRS